MIEVPTVLILGAGASAHLGYPVGPQLKEDICHALLVAPYRDLAPHIRQHWTEPECRRFATRLGNSAYDSIDAFLGANRESVELGKAAIVQRLVGEEVSERLIHPEPDAWSVGWYADLFKALASDCAAENLPENRLTVVTFNYDRSLEVFLTVRIANHYDLPEREALELMGRLRIIHPHGVMGDFPTTPYRQHWDDMEHRVKCIKILHEFRDGDGDGSFCSNEFAEANAALVNCERAFFLGFGFHDDNMRRLRFFNSVLDRKRLVLSTHRRLPNAMEKEFLERTNTKYHLSASKVFQHEVDCNQFFHEVCRLR